MSKPKKEENFQREINCQEDWEDLMQRDGLKVIDIYQEWCGPCQATRNIFKQLNYELNDPMLFFAVANVDRVDSLEIYRGRTEPYFLFFGGSVLVAVVKGANCPELESVTHSMLKQEHEVLAGDLVRVEIEDLYLKEYLDEKAAEEKRQALLKEIDQETAILVILPELVGTELAEYIVDLVQVTGFDILRDETMLLGDQVQDILLDDEMDDSDYVQRVQMFSSAASRCILLTKGPQGVIHDLSRLVGPKSQLLEDETQNLDGEEENEDELITSIRDQLGEGAPKSCVKLLYSVESNDALRKLLFPDFEPPKVIIYLKEVDTDENIAEDNVDVEDFDSEAEQDSDESSGLPDYVGPPRVVIVARPSAYATYHTQILAKLVEWGYEVINTKEYTFTEEEAEVYYAEYKNMSLFPSIIKEVTSRPSFVIVVRKDDAYKTFKDHLGPESFSRAIEDPTTLRGLYSAIPNQVKADDMTWVDGTTNAQDAAKLIAYFFPVEDTLAALKPDSTIAHEELLENIKNAGFKLVTKKEVTLSAAEAKLFYEHSKDKPYIDDLVKAMISGPTLFVILRASDAVRAWRKLIGPTDPDLAVDMYPIDVKPESVCVRGIYGKTILENAIHGSSTIEEARKNINLIFGENFYTKDDEETDEEEEEDEEESEDEDLEEELGNDASAKDAAEKAVAGTPAAEKAVAGTPAATKPVPDTPAATKPVPDTPAVAPLPTTPTADDAPETSN